MRIAYIGLRGIPVGERGGGIERAVEEIGTRLVTMGHQVTVYGMKSAQTQAVPSYRGVALRYVPTIPAKNLETLIYSLIATVGSSLLHYDIVHLHALGPANLSFIPRLLRHRTVVTVHGLDWKREKWGRLARTYLRLGELSSCWFPHATIVVSRSLQDYFRVQHGRKTIYIPNGIPLAPRRPLESVRDLGIEKGHYVLFVGRLTPEKNVHQLIKAFRQVQTTSHLVIVGSAGHLSDYHRTLRDLAGDDRRIVFAGSRYGQALDELYSNAVLFVLPSALEGLPIALLEAMSFGLPVLVSNIAENLEVIEGDKGLCGLTFQVGDIEDLKTTLASALAEGDLRHDLALKGQSLVTSKYNWDTIARETEAVYRDLLSH